MPEAVNRCSRTLPGTRVSRLRRARRCTLALATLGVMCALITACASEEYAAEATFCDDWCHTLRRTSCDQEPENCVRDCERALPSEACLEHQVLLLDCYRNTPPEGFACVEQGFQGTIRPLPDICRPERDALVGCAAPRVLSCIEACRALDEADPVLAPDAQEAPAESCPSSPMPCERLCWAVDGAGARQAPAGRDALETLPAIGAGEDLGVLGAALVGCAREGARRCWEQAQAGELGEAVSWTGSFFECAAPFVSSGAGAPAPSAL